MPDEPLAYLITFTTYGTWLHGDDRGSVDVRHNEYDTPCLAPDATRFQADRAKLSQDVYRMDAARRAVACDAVIEECQFRGWQLLAAHVRSNHVHALVNAKCDPDTVVAKCKSRISRRLNLAGFDGSGRKRWTEHGSTKYLWTGEAVVDAVDYVLNRQGDVMARYEGRWREFLGLSP